MTAAQETLEPLAEGLWTVERRFRTLGLPVASRGTIARLPDGTLAVVNPPRLDESLRAAVAELGVPTHLICPNRFHHLFVGAWKQAWPQAALWGAPGLAEKRSDLSFDGVPGRDPAPFTETLAPLPIDGMPRLVEVWFRHRPSGTLVTTDLLACPGPGQPWFLRLWLRLNGAGGGGRVGSAAWLRLLVRDRAALASSLERALESPPRALVVAHGDPLTDPAQAEMAVRRALRRFL